ncbi:MAG: hypothetical protein A2W19_09435 [Spirochaetes bacterium RBG_16_49_21]|nr:MAG: hypothetical protein A2W19_09435 [Spirochaetes bacterium RBG_16_49_21]
MRSRCTKNLYIACPLYAILIMGCINALIKSPITVSKDAYDITLTMLTFGPDQYNTAGGYREPKTNRRFAWATISIHNKLQTEQQLHLERILLVAGKKMFKPRIIDMDSPLTMSANPSPRVAPDETISRKLIYAVPDSVIPQKIVYEKTEIIIP